MPNPVDPLERRCPKCGLEQPSGRLECARCGVIFSKLGKPAPSGTRAGGAPIDHEELDSATARFLRRALFVPEDVNPIELAGRAVVWLGLLLLGWSFVWSPIERSQVSPTFIHFLLSRVDLVFHEAGHYVFLPLGSFMATLGGSLLQVLVPVICSVAFLTRHLDPFGASATLWWTGQNFIDVAPYINDARAQQMILLGGVTGRDAPGYHDWNNLLSRLGLLHLDHSLAKLAHFTGSLLIVIALAWGGYLLWLQYRTVKST